jgi:uncharacterized protein
MLIREYIQMRHLFILLAFLGGGVPALANVAGNWSGDLSFPQGNLRFLLHITGPDNDLSAIADSPDQNAKGLPVDSIRKDENTLVFRMSDLNVQFTGEISGEQIRGTFTQKGVDVPLTLSRSNGDSNGDTAKDASEPSSDLAGTWAGALTFSQGTLRFVLHITGRDADLRATADSPDQKSYGMPVESITMSNQTLRFAMNSLNARFEGKISSDEIRGTFSQNGNDVPLKLARQ